LAVLIQEAVMDQARMPREPDDAGAAEEAAPGTGVPKTGFECPTCGDRFPSQDALDEHLPEHKTV
jgi:hypothetical protein